MSQLAAAVSTVPAQRTALEELDRAGNDHRALFVAGPGDATAADLAARVAEGSEQLLVLTEHLPKFAWVGHRWVRFAIERMGVTRVVLVAHEGCLWYQDERFVPALLHRLAHGGTTAEHQRADLRHAAEGLRGLGLPLAVEAWFVARGVDGRLEFHSEPV